MKRIIYLFALLVTSQLSAFYAGVGCGWNTIDETFDSNLPNGVGDHLTSSSVTSNKTA